ncbi:MAG: ATP-binding cassette domain-containing protein [Rhodospirillales bacterium]
MKELYQRLFSHPTIATEIIVASLFANILALASSLYVIQVLNRYVSHGVNSTLVTLTSGVLIAVVMEFFFRQIRMRLAQGVSMGPDQKAAISGFHILTQAKPAALQRIPEGIRREIINGATAIETAYSPSNINVVVDVPFALLFVGVLFLLSPLIAWIVIIFLVGVFVFGAFMAASLRSDTDSLIEASGGASALVSTANREIETVRAFNAGAFLRRAWEEQLQKTQRLRRHLAMRQGFIQSMTQSATALMSVAVIAVGATLVVEGKLDVGAMIGANILAVRALQPVSRFSQLGESFAKARRSLALLAEFSRIPLEPSSGSAKTDYRGAVELRDVAFIYPGSNTPLFESLSLKLPPGAILVVNGLNGTGKTTLARLLIGLLDPSRGHVLADGLDLRQVTPEWWRRQVIYLPQEPSFLNATIEQNIRVTNPDIDNAGLNRVIDLAGLRRFLDESEKGFETPISLDGRQLSLGIRRRLALARALSTAGRLAVLDEPTEGLDKEGCAAVYSVLNELARRGHTIVVISHDPNILKGAHAVVDLTEKPVPKVTIVSKGSAVLDVGHDASPGEAPPVPGKAAQ